MQELSGIALMVDGALFSISQGRLDEAREIIGRRSPGSARRSGSCATSRSRSSQSCSATTASSRPCASSPTSSASATRTLTVELDLAGADALGKTAEVALYTIIRELIEQSVRRGPPTRIDVSLQRPTRAA